MNKEFLQVYLQLSWGLESAVGRPVQACTSSQRPVLVSVGLHQLSPAHTAHSWAKLWLFSEGSILPSRGILVKRVIFIEKGSTHVTPAHLTFEIIIRF